MTERWMSHLREQRPEEFERLQELRQKDPELFRKELHVRLRREVGSRLQNEHPAIHDAIKNLPEPEREWLFSRIAGPDGPGPRMGDGHAFRPPDEQRDEDFGPALRAYRQSASEVERTQARRKLRAEIQTSLERKNQRRREELDQLEARLKQMREQLDAREAQAAALIDAKLDEITGAPAGSRP